MLGVVQWNPHWQCFEGRPACAANASAALSGLLASSPHLDFANVVELEDAAYKPPAGWAAIGGGAATCGRDWDTLFYRADRWKPRTSQAGCLYDSRSFALGTFERLGSSSFEVTVVGAHFPQTLNASTHAYANATSKLKQLLLRAAGTSANVLLAADTNTENATAAAAAPSHHGVNKSNAQIMHDIYAWPDVTHEPPSSRLFKSCCFNDGFSWQGDRIIANFGSAPETRVLFDPPPEWAAFDSSEFHKGVMLTLTVDENVLVDGATVEAR